MPGEAGHQKWLLLNKPLLDSLRNASRTACRTPRSIAAMVYDSVEELLGSILHGSDDVIDNLIDVNRRGGGASPPPKQRFGGRHFRAGSPSGVTPMRPAA